MTSCNAPFVRLVSLCAIVLLATACMDLEPIEAEETTEELLSRSYVLAAVPVKGDTTCRWGSPDCNRCVNDVRGQLDTMTTNYRYAGRIRFDGYAYPTSSYLLNRINRWRWGVATYEHIQGVGRIAGIGDDEYMVFTHSTDSDQTWKTGALAVVRMGADRYSNGYPFGGMPYGDGANQSTANRTVARSSSSNNHPGGLSVLGHYVYVAQWCQDEGNESDWCKESSVANKGFGFSVYDVSSVADNGVIGSHPPAHRYYKHVFGEAWIGDSSTASVAAARLRDGSYLVALGKSGGREYGFYAAASPTGPFYFQDNQAIGKFGENANFLTDCASGDLYLLQLEAYANSSDQAHLYRVLKAGDQYGFEFIKSRTFTCRGSSINGAGDWCNFDAGVGSYVSPTGDLAIYATDWHQSSSGNIRLVEFF